MRMAASDLLQGQSPNREQMEQEEMVLAPQKLQQVKKTPTQKTNQVSVGEKKPKNRVQLPSCSGPGFAGRFGRAEMMLGLL